MFGIPTAAGCYYAYQYKQKYDEMKDKIQKRKEATQERITAIKETAAERKEFYIQNFKGRIEEQKEKFLSQQMQVNETESAEETVLLNEGIQKKRVRDHIIESANLIKSKLPEETQEKAEKIKANLSQKYAEKKENFKLAIQKRQDQRQQDQLSISQVSQLDSIGKPQQEQQEVKLTKD